LHGRSHDLAAVTAFIRTHEPGLVLTGVAGVGKTKLAREATRVAVEHDVAVVWVQATASAREIPFGAMAPYLPAVDATLDMLPMLMHAGAALRVLAGGRNLLLVLDDAPLIDNASALLVSQLVAAGDASVLITQRSGAALPEPLAGLRLPRRELGTLDLDATAAVAEELTGRVSASPPASACSISAAATPCSCTSSCCRPTTRARGPRRPTDCDSTSTSQPRRG